MPMCSGASLLLADRALVLTFPILEGSQLIHLSRQRDIQAQDWYSTDHLAHHISALLDQAYQVGAQPPSLVYPLLPADWVASHTNQSRIQLNHPTALDGETFKQAYDGAAPHPLTPHSLMLLELPADYEIDGQWQTQLHALHSGQTLTVTRHAIFAPRQRLQTLSKAVHLLGLLVAVPQVATVTTAHTLAQTKQQAVGLLDLIPEHAVLALIHHETLRRFHVLQAPTCLPPLRLVKEVAQLLDNLPLPLRQDTQFYVLDRHRRIPPILSSLASQAGLTLLAGSDAALAEQLAQQAVYSLHQRQ